MSYLVEYWAYIVPAVIVILALCVAGYLFKNWHLVAIAGAVFSFVIVVGRVFSAGERASKERQVLLTQKAIRRVEETKAEVGGLSNAEVDAQLSQWVKR